MRIVEIIFYGILIYFSIAGLQAQTVLGNLDDIAAFGSENNLDYRSSRIEVIKAEENLQGLFLVDQSSLSATGSYSDASGGTWGVNSSVTIPVIEQLSLSASIDQNLSGNASVTLSPLAHSDTREQSEITLDKAMVSAETSRLDAELGAVTAALNWMSATRDYATQQLQAELSGTKYLDDKIRFDLGEITFDDLQESLVQWSEDRVTLTEKEKLYRDAELTLYSELGAGKDEVTVKELSVDEIENALEDLISDLDPDRGDYLKSGTLQMAVLNKLSSEEALKNTWIYEPDLRAGASLSFDEQGLGSVSASVTLTFSLGQFGKTEREISEEEYMISSVREIQSRSEAELEFSQLIDTIESSSLNSEIAGIELEQAEILLSEAELLFDRGDISQLDLEESRLSYSASENALFKALAEEYKSWIELKEYL